MSRDYVSYRNMTDQQLNIHFTAVRFVWFGLLYLFATLGCGLVALHELRPQSPWGILWILIVPVVGIVHYRFVLRSARRMSRTEKISLLSIHDD